MKTKHFINLLTICVSLTLGTFMSYAQGEEAVKEITGLVIDAETHEPLMFSDLVINGSNISTVSNSDGEFILKIPISYSEKNITISRLGYGKKFIPISSIGRNYKIELDPILTQLQPVEITALKDAKALFIECLKNKHSIYNNDHTVMTAFYRETIKKRRKNASLSEAIVQIHKRPYNSTRQDAINLIKARKNTNYDRLDTIALKLQGGPFSNLYTDIIKYPEYIFTEEDIPLYNFSYDKSTRNDNNLIYVINFKQKPHIQAPLFYGKLYIDAKTLALTSAVFSLNVENKELSSRMYVRKKPKKVDVYPTEANYRVNYRTQNGKWYYSYSNILLTFKVNWKGKLFNSTYTLNSEMAVTDWEVSNTKLADIRQNIIRPNTILTDKVSGFRDPEFWGKYNIIEPDKTIETAIKKIQRQLNKS
ncbi:carboxypeptidase-like regulatory domain-containing protein [Gaetbulibacter saemankumensis]|uniref:carboxypeptidase-like regulatory domain-containing protein n=1 Tax=Gaetbulibacter saemankumensis TaxID=311208 RepID=UPI000482CE3C|nr:carboxypeptidase-like regulatory domain-containing protein [Gaetbulibacter saemankumensis]